LRLVELLGQVPKVPLGFLGEVTLVLDTPEMFVEDRFELSVSVP